MNVFILANIMDIMQSPHPVFGVSIGLCLLLFVLFKVFSSNRSPIPPPNFQPPPIEYGEHKFNGSGFCDKCGINIKYLRGYNMSECKLDNYEKINKRMDSKRRDDGESETTENVSVKEQLLIDLRKATAMGMMTKQEYESKRQKILNMP